MCTLKSVHFQKCVPILSDQHISKYMFVVTSGQDLNFFYKSTQNGIKE